MAKFWLIQTGRVTTSPRNNPYGPKNVIDNVQLDYMGAAEFEWGALPKALARMMKHYGEYSTAHTGIYTPDGDEVILFCKNDDSETVVGLLNSYFEQPYELKGFSPIVPKANMFWWCIDYNGFHARHPQYGRNNGDWIACTSSDYELVKNSLDAAYEIWMMMPDEEREKLYHEATH